MPNSPDPLLVERYRQTMMEWAKLVFPHCFINLDETKWHYANPPRLVIYRKGHRHVIGAGANPTHGMTAILCGSAAGDKLKPAIVIRCKPSQEERVKAEHKAILGDTCVVYTSESGWANGDIILDYITNIIHPYADSHMCFLLLDKFK